MQAIKKGLYYASQGPVISTKRSGSKITIECSPVCEVVFYTGKAYTPKRCIVGKDITNAEYRIENGDIFVRAELKDENGNYAWTQYYTEA